MTSSLPNVPLWPRASRTGTSFAMGSSSRRTDPAGAGATGGGAVGSPSRRPKPTGRRSVTVTALRSGLRGLGTGADPTRLELRRRRADRAEALEASEQLPFLVVQPVL